MNRVIGAVALLALLLSPYPAHPATLTWNLPTSYTDDTPIPLALIGTIVTNIYSGPSRTGPWALSAATPPGALEATVPDPGQIVWYAITATLGGVESELSDSVTRTPKVFLSGTPTVNGSPLAAGDELSAYSVHPRPGAPGKWERTLIAREAIGTGVGLAGVPAYGDDPATAGVVEGAVPGEEISLTLWRAGEGKMYHAYTDPAGQPVSVAWPGDGATVPVDVDFVEGTRIPLRTGAWNLFSYGVLKGWHKGAVPPASAQLPGVAWDNVPTPGDSFPLQSIAGKYERLMANDGAGAVFWNPALPGISTMSYIAPGYGYWVKMKPSATGQLLSWMTVPGRPANGDESLALGPGWTLAGYWGSVRSYTDGAYDAGGELLPPSATDFQSLPSIGDLWASLDPDYARVTSFDGSGAHLWNPSLPQTRTLNYMGPGYGYWIRTGASGTLTYPAGTK